MRVYNEILIDLQPQAALPLQQVHTFFIYYFSELLTSAHSWLLTILPGDSSEFFFPQCEKKTINTEKDKYVTKLVVVV